MVIPTVLKRLFIKNTLLHLWLVQNVYSTNCHYFQEVSTFFFGVKKSFAEAYLMSNNNLPIGERVRWVVQVSNVFRIFYETEKFLKVGLYSYQNVRV